MNGLAGRTRTCGLVVPNDARFPAALRRAESTPSPAARGPQVKCGPVARAAGLLCHIQVVKEQAGAFRSREKIWCPTRDSNPDQRASEARAYPVSASGAHKNKKPGDLAAHPGLEGFPAMMVARRSPRPGPHARRPRVARMLSVEARCNTNASCVPCPSKRRSPNRVDAPETKRPGASGPRRKNAATGAAHRSKIALRASCSS